MQTMPALYNRIDKLFEYSLINNLKNNNQYMRCIDKFKHKMITFVPVLLKTEFI